MGAQKVTFREYADKYELETSEVIQAKNDWLCSEGYDGNGEEYNLIEWLDTFCAKTVTPKNSRRYEDKTPYQKGDDWDL